MRRLLRTIRFDASDEAVFERAALADEWAVSGAFEFANDDGEPTGKRRQAFRNGFLGTTSFGRSTLVAVAGIEHEERQRVVDDLTRHLLECYGAPSEVAARQAAESEVRFAEELADRPLNTLVAVERTLGPDGIVERFRTIERSAARPHAKIWSLEPEDPDG
jgi:hypothetical protein